MIDIPLLKRICETPGAPGFEKRIRDLVQEEVSTLCDEIMTDAMGNLIAIKNGKEDKKVMVAAHMDEISFIVTHIDEEGFIRFHTLGGFDPKTLTSQRVIVHGKKDVIGVMGTKPIHVMKPEERKRVVPITEYFIDTGMKKAAVEKIISIGDPITREREMIVMGDCINSKSLDNRISVYILIETLRALKNSKIPYDFYAAFTVQEEVGLRGAINSAGVVDPDFGIGLDVTVAFDVPGAQPHEMITRLGRGTAIKIMDGSTICDYRMVDYMKKTAKKSKIKWQPEVLTAGGTDTAGLQRYGKHGSIAGAISIPLRNLHQTIEMCHKSDVEASIKLLTNVVKGLDKHNWEL